MPTPGLVINSYMFQKLIGSGSFGSVYIGHKLDQRDSKVAIKCIRKPRRKVEEAAEPNDEVARAAVERARREFLTLRQVAAVGGHPNVLRFVDVVQTKEWLYIFTEHLSGGPLSVHGSILRQHPQLLLHVSLQILSGLAFLHSHNIAHRDIKEENLVLADPPSEDWSNLRVVIIDLGLNKPGAVEDDIHTACGSAKYVAPEVLAQHAPFDAKACDIWSLGVVVYHLSNGCFPFNLDQGRSDGDVVGRLLALRAAPHPPSLTFHNEPGPYTDILNEFCRACLQRNPAERKTALQLYEALRGVMSR